MGISLNLANLKSRITRLASTSNSGIRIFASNANAAIQHASEEEATNFWDGLKRFGASIISALTWQPDWVKFSFSKITSFFVTGIQQLLHFNWNASDEELDKQIEQTNIAIATARGQLRGTVAAELICGVLPSATIAVFNEALALHVLEEVGEQAAGEIAAQATVLIRLTLEKTVKQTFIGIFKNFRSILRPAAIGFAQLLKEAGVIDQEAVDKANKKRNEPWTIAGTIQDTADRIESPVQRAEYTAFWDQFGSECIHAGFVVAGAIDSYFIEQKIQQNATQGDEHTVLFNPDGSINISATPASP